MDTKDKYSFEELAGSPSPNQKTDEGHDEWVHEQVMLALKEGQDNPDSYISEDEIWKEFGFKDAD